MAMEKIESIGALLRAHEEKKKQAEARRAKLKRELDQILDEADGLEKEAAKKRKDAMSIYEEMGALDYGNWMSDVLWPLADELARRTGKHPQLSGPAGLGSKLTIALVDNPDKRSYEQESLEITVEPAFEDERIFFNYETGEVSDRYEPGTVGYVNGFNNITARLPDSVEEILGLLRHYPALTTKTKGGAKHEPVYKDDRRAEGRSAMPPSAREKEICHRPRGR